MTVDTYIEQLKEDGKSPEEIIGIAYEDKNGAEEALRDYDREIEYLSQQRESVSRERRLAVLVLRAMGEDE